LDSEQATGFSSFADLGLDLEAPETPDSLDALDVESDTRAPSARESTYQGADSEVQEALRLELQNLLGAYLKKGRARVVITDNVHTMLSVKRGTGVLTFRLHHMFLEAPAGVLREVVRYAESQSRSASAALRKFIDHNDDLVRRSTSPRQVTLDVEGRHHNLQEIFEELNEEYFASSVQARITWGPRVKRKKSRESIKLGSYTVEDELIRIHPVLDASDVPRFFVAWIVFHEMLHEIHDMPIVDGRRVYHTREFRDAEARFEHYTESVLWERMNIHRLLER
jgi:hypothetical protein